MKIKPIFFLCTALLLTELLLFREFIFGKAIFIFKDLGSDSYNVEYPNLINRAAFFHNFAFPNYSFHNGLGENTYGFSFEPVSFLLCLFRIPAETIMLLTALIYIFLSGIMMYLFLQLFSLHDKGMITGGLFYAFAAYSLLSSSWCVTLLAPLSFLFIFLLWALERSLQTGRFWILIFPVALLGINQPVNLYFAALIIICYLCARAFLYKTNLKNFFRQLVKISLWSATGIGISGFMLFSNLYLMLRSPRGTGIVQPILYSKGVLVEKGEALSLMLRLISPNSLGNVNHFRAYYNYLEAPLLYSGLFFILLIPACANLLSARAKKIMTAGFAAFVLIFLFPPLRHLLWLKTGEYYRLLNIFFVLFVIIVGSFIFSKYLNAPKRMNLLILLLTCACILTLLILSNEWSPGSSSSFSFPAIIICSYAFFIGYFRKIKSIYIFKIFFLLVLADIVFAGNSVINDRDAFTAAQLQSSGYNDGSKKIISNLNNKDSSFFRLEKTLYSGNSMFYSYNEAHVQDFNSSSVYSSFNNANYINFLSLYGVINSAQEPETRFVEGVRKFPAMAKLLSVKYFIEKDDPVTESVLSGFTIKQENGNFRLLEDTAYLPLGFFYDRIMRLSQFASLPDSTKQQVSFKALVVDDKNLPFFSLPLPEGVDSIPERQNIESLRQNAMRIKTFGAGVITAEAESAKQAAIFFSIPFDKGWQLTDNGETRKIYKAFGGLMAAPLGKGFHKITLAFKPPYKVFGIWITILSLTFLILIEGLTHFKNKLISAKNN